jgi:transposase InsO family protein
MTQSGNPKDNAIAERVNGILKREFLDFETFETIGRVKVRMDEVVCFYNNKLLHRSLNMMTPIQAASLNGSIRKKWKCYKDKYNCLFLPASISVHLQ